MSLGFNTTFGHPPIPIQTQRVSQRQTRFYFSKERSPLVRRMAALADAIFLAVAAGVVAYMALKSTFMAHIPIALAGITAITTYLVYCFAKDYLIEIFAS